MSESKHKRSLLVPTYLKQRVRGKEHRKRDEVLLVGDMQVVCHVVKLHVILYQCPAYCVHNRDVDLRIANAPAIKEVQQV